MAISSIQPGHRIGGLTVVKLDHRRPRGNTSMPYFECLCKCGNTCVLRSDRLSEGGSFPAVHCQSRKNHNANFIVHGLSRTPEYRTLIRMMSRCYNKKNKAYMNYGGRGITVFEGWHNSVEAFYKHIGPRPSPRHSIERIDNNGNYEPGNVKWAIRLEQQQNTRHNRYVTFNGEKLCISECARRVGIGHPAMAKRIRQWGIEKAMTTPKQMRYDHGQRG